MTFSTDNQIVPFCRVLPKSIHQ